MIFKRVIVGAGRPNLKISTIRSRKRWVGSVIFQDSSKKSAAIAVLLCGVPCLFPAQAQETNGPAVDANEPMNRPGEIRNATDGGFRAGVQQAGFAVGAGIPAHQIGNTSSHNLVLSKIYYGWMLGGVKAQNKWYQGNWEVMEELLGGAQAYPSVRYVAGETTVLRYNFATGTRWVPFLDGGAGVLGTDIGRPDLGSVFEFNEQGGPGVNYFWRKNSALTFQYRYTHISNAGIKKPNEGVNEHMLYAGITWYF